MDTHKLVKMANQIALFFEGEPEASAMREGIASHLKRFWEPRMRRELLAWIDENGGVGLRESVLAAVAEHRARLQGQ